MWSPGSATISGRIEFKRTADAVHDLHLEVGLAFDHDPVDGVGLGQGGMEDELDDDLVADVTAGDLMHASRATRFDAAQAAFEGLGREQGLDRLLPAIQLLAEVVREEVQRLAQAGVAQAAVGDAFREGGLVNDFGWPFCPPMKIEIYSASRSRS